ncbi:MAG: efflux RND transporter permease subunit, partial [Deltaproteobacteria bacterium]|nr:efflux RND transporter permease subunit [Deltaproteobacteria bacterium]
RLIRGAIEQLSSSAFWGFFFATAILFLFLFSFRTTFTLILSMLLAVVATFIAIYFSGETLNIMTLSGIALGIGLIVDNSIVVMENIFRHIEKGEKRTSAAKIGASEVGMAISASTLTTVIVFLPMALSSGATGILTRSIGITVVFSILASLVIALTVVPPIGSRMFRVKRKKGDFKLFDRLKGFYVRMLHHVLNNQGKAIIFSLSLFLLALLLFQAVGTEYIPKMDESDGTAVIKLEPGLSLKDSDAFLREMERVISSLPEFVSMVAMVGRSEVSTIDMVFGIAPSDVNEGEMYFELRPKKERNRTYREICDEIYKNINLRKGCVVYFMDTMDWFLGGGERPIEIKIFGSDLEELLRLGKAAEECMREVQGVCDLDNSMKPGRPELQIKVDREKASKLGITVGQISSTVDTAFLGKKSGKYRVAGDEYDIRVKYIEFDRDEPNDLSSVVISSPFGSTHYLAEIAEVVKGTGPARIHREDQRRVVVLSANVSERDLGSTVEEIRRKLSNLDLPEGYYIKYGGAYEDMEEMQEAIMLAFILVILLVYLVMCAQFESFLYPLAIIFSVPMALIGVSLILFVTRTTLSLMSFIGVLMLVGISVNNAIVLIDYINQLRRKGVKKTEAIIEAGITRLRPILMSSSTTVLALMPLSILKGDGSEIFAPISITLLGGLLVSTFLTLLIIPAWYSVLDGWSGKLLGRKLE